MDSELWKPRQRIEQQYQRAIKRLTSKIWDLVDINVDDPQEISRRIARLVRSKAYTEYAQAAAMNMVKGVFSDSGRTWRQASRANMGGQQVHQALRSQIDGQLAAALQIQIDRNVELIKSMPEDIAADVVDYIKEQSLSGRRASDLIDDILAKFPDATTARATLIARTETSKTTTALTRARAENVGIRWYAWRTSEDARVRSSHAHMDGVLIPWDNPPSPEALDPLKLQKPYGYYHAGETYNCRCYCEPLIRLDFVDWPARVYMGNRLVKMSKVQFERMTGG